MQYIKAEEVCKSGKNRFRLNSVGWNACLMKMGERSSAKFKIKNLIRHELLKLEEKCLIFRGRRKRLISAEEPFGKNVLCKPSFQGVCRQNRL